MPTITVDDGCPIYVEVEGRESAPALMLSNSLGTNLHMWDDQAPEFAKHFRLIRYDRRGHGQSGIPQGPYSMERLGRDVLAVLDALKIKKTNWCGLSMGGMVGQWLGANAPDRVEKLVLSNTNSYYADKAPWNDRIKFVTENGLEALVDANMQRWFTEGFRKRAPDVLARMRAMFVATKLPGYIGCCEAVRDMDFREFEPAHHDADPGDRRRARRRHAAVGGRDHPEGDFRRQARQPRGGAHFQHGAAQGLYRHRSQLPAIERPLWTKRTVTSAA